MQLKAHLFTVKFCNNLIVQSPVASVSPLVDDGKENITGVSSLMPLPLPLLESPLPVPALLALRLPPVRSTSPSAVRKGFGLHS